METLRWRWESAGLAGVVAEVVRARVEEALDTPYTAWVELELDDPTADPMLMLGTDAVLTIEREPATRRLCGIVSDVALGQGHEGTHEGFRLDVRVRVVPALAVLALRRNTRIFQGKTVPELLADVLGAGLGDYGRSAQQDLTRSYLPREYCVQYQETDLDFVQRLMEEEGIFYSFEHEGETEVMILRDANSSCPRVTCDSDPIELHADNLHVRDREVIDRMHVVHRETTTAVTVREWDWSAGGTMIVEANAEGQDAHGRVRESYEHSIGRTLTITGYDAGARRYQQNDSAAQARLRHEGHAAPGRVAFGFGRVIGFTPGTTFELVNHPVLGVDGEYLITSVVHEDRRSSAGGAPGGDDEAYQNRFTCIPLAVPHRPARRARKPRIPSVQTAMVTGPDGEEIHVDEHGRIKVQFFWDRENPANETSSCWIRCEQDWGGAGWGFWWVPRIGMEVVVQFLDGDPDRPVVTGCVYDAANALPYAMPDEKTKSTIKSNSSLGGGGFNEFRFEDKAGSEEIYTHAQKDYDEVVEHNHTTLVHHDQTIEVDNDQTQIIHVNQTERVDANQDMSVGSNRSVHVEGNFTETVSGTESRTTTGDVTEDFGASETRSIAASVTETVSGNETRKITGSQFEEIGASHTQTIGGASALTVGGALTQQVGAAASTTTPAATTLIASGGMSVKCAAATWKAPAGVTLVAPGGWTFLDNVNEWLGTLLVDVSGVEDLKYTGMKIEVGGSSWGITGAKVSTYMIHIELGASLDDKEGSATLTVACDAETGCRINLAGVTALG